MKNIFVGERPHPHDESGMNEARYYFAREYVEKKSVLDVGCATGYGSAILAKNAKQVVGVDYDKNVIAYAKKNYKKKNITFIHGDVNKKQQLSNFDILTAFEIIEHIEEDEQFVKSLKKLVKKTGIVLISTPNKLISSPNMKHPPNPFHVREYTPQEFGKILTRVFSDVTVYGIQIKNKQKKTQEKTMQSTLRWKLASTLVKNRSVRTLANYFPRGLKARVTGEHNLKLSSHDFELSKKSISSCPYLFAVCRP